VRRIRPRPIGLSVGALLLVTNARDLVGWADLGAVRWLIYGAAVALVAAAALTPRWTRNALA
jgi:hypothetical protein